MKKEWWHDKIFYQIYPKSFYDSNGDGIGDINGIIEKLDYLKDLGVDIIWISPVYKSPFVDQGYDISDYYDIDPIFGTMEDMDRLLRISKEKEIGVLMDLVVNHCSNKHEWFLSALNDPNCHDYFYFEKGKNGNPPNNLRSYFGGSAWEKIPETDEYYLHLYAKEQPDINWDNPIILNKIYNVINWWLEKGLSGFRVDAIVNIQKDLPFKNYEPDRIDGLANPERMINAANGLYDKLMHMKQNTFDKYNALSVAELFEYDPNNIDKYLGENGCFSTLFDFETNLIGNSIKGWYDRTKPTAMEYRDTIYKSQSLVNGIGYMCNIIENHDEPRGTTRYLPENACNDYGKKMLATITLMLRGIPFLYQGQEIGMENKKYTSINEIDDLYTISEYNLAIEHGLTENESMQMVNLYSRDHSRTPMQWNDFENSGFTTGTPWMSINENYKEINVSSQIHNETSILSYYKKLINLRKNPIYKNILVQGYFVPKYQNIKNLIAFTRIYNDEKILVLANFSTKNISIPMSLDKHYLLCNNYIDVISTETETILNPMQSLVIYLNDE